jgi:hypothetical protein
MLLEKVNKIKKEKQRRRGNTVWFMGSVENMWSVLCTKYIPL